VARVLLVAVGEHSSPVAIAVALAVMGGGVGGFEAPNDVAVLAELPPDRLSAGTALLNAVRNVGMTLGTAGGGALIATGMRGAGNETAKVAHGVGLALTVGAACAGL